jgi:hypothetical protein
LPVIFLSDILASSQKRAILEKTETIIEKGVLVHGVYLVYHGMPVTKAENPERPLTD